MSCNSIAFALTSAVVLIDAIALAISKAAFVVDIAAITEGIGIRCPFVLMRYNTALLTQATGGANAPGTVACHGQALVMLDFTCNQQGVA